MSFLVGQDFVSFQVVFQGFNGFQRLGLGVESLDFDHIAGGIVLAHAGFGVGDFVNGALEVVVDTVGPASFPISHLGGSAAVVQDAFVGAVVVINAFRAVEGVVFGVKGAIQGKCMRLPLKHKSVGPYLNVKAYPKLNCDSF